MGPLKIFKFQSTSFILQKSILHVVKDLHIQIYFYLQVLCLKKLSIAGERIFQSEAPKVKKKEKPGEYI